MYRKIDMSNEEERDIFPFPGKVKSSVWEFFGFYKDDFGSLDKSRAICKLCRRGTNYSGNTTNLRTHIVHHHKSVAALPDVNYSRAQLSRSVPAPHTPDTNFGASFFNQLVTTPEGHFQSTPPKMQRQVVLDEIFIPPLSSDITGTLGRSPAQQNTWIMETATGLIESPAVYSKESPARENSSGSFADSEVESYGSVLSVRDTIFEMVIHDLIPIEVVDSPRFKKLIALGKKYVVIPSSQDICNLILRRYTELQAVVAEELSQGTHKSLKLEIWKSKDITYLTVSIQALFENWKMGCYVLKTSELHDKFSVTDLESILEERKLGFGFNGIAILSDEDNSIDEFADEKHCLHIVALCNTIDTIARICVEENVGENLIVKLQNIIKFFNENEEAKSILLEKQKVLHLPAKCLVNCNTKVWSTCLEMFETILEQSNAIIASFNDAKVQVLKQVQHLTSSDFALVQTLIHLLMPLKTALTLTKDMKYPTASVILPVLKKLEVSMACRETDSQQIIDLKKTMIIHLKRNYEETSRRQFLLLCSLLDPRFKGLKFVSQSDQDLAYDHLKRDASVLKNRCKVEEPETFPSNKCVVKIEVDEDYADNHGTVFDMYVKNTEEANRTSAYHQNNKRQKLMETSPNACDSKTDDWFADVIQELKDGQPEKDSVTVEINRYKSEMQISSASSPLTWWRDRQKSFPLLSQLAKRYLCVPALQGTRDEVKEKWYQRQRSCVPAHLVEPIIFLHANYDKVRKLRDEF